jgi:methylmalonyl-CoA epimerase
MESHIVGIHHIGIVVSDIQAKSDIYVNTFGYTPESDIIPENNQKVIVQFLSLGETRIELIQPMDEDSPVYKFLQKGGIINHICYETDDVDEAVKYLRKQYRAVLTYSVNWSESLEKCRYAFLAKPDGEVIELLQFMD